MLPLCSPSHAMLSLLNSLPPEQLRETNRLRSSKTNQKKVTKIMAQSWAEFLQFAGCSRGLGQSKWHQPLTNRDEHRTGATQQSSSSPDLCLMGLWCHIPDEGTGSTPLPSLGWDNVLVRFDPPRILARQTWGHRALQKNPSPAATARVPGPTEAARC